jgi:hypothetical protein
MAVDCLAQNLISGEQFQLPQLSIAPREERYMIHTVPHGTRLVTGTRAPTLMNVGDGGTSRAAQRQW